MSSLLSTIALFAQRAQWEQMGGRFGTRNRFTFGDAILWLGLLLSFVFSLYLLSLYAKSRDKKGVSNSPVGLFKELCKEHGLNFRNRKLLSRLATETKLQQPAALFLDPNRFHASNLPNSLKREAKAFAEIKKTIFD